MNLPLNLRRRLVRLVLLGAGTLAVGLLAPAYSAAGQDASRAEERVSRSEERSTLRAQEQARRAQEREARRTVRAEEREARQSAGGAAGSGSEESGESSAGTGEDATNPPAGEPGTPASGDAARVCRASIAAGSEQLASGEPVTLSGTLTCPTGVSAADQQLVVYERQDGAGAHGFAILATVSTEADGSYSIVSGALSADTTFQVREGRRRERTVVKVAPLVTLAVAAPPAQVSTVGDHALSAKRVRPTFTGTVTPADTGALVALQVADPGSSEHWRTVAIGHVDADGSYAIAHTFRTPGEASVRTVVHTGAQNATAVSEAVSYEVAQPQNSQLTIQTSADPLVYGQTVTISGVAAGTPSQPVKLLARTQAGTFVVLAEGTTDESGNYTFEQAPLASTEYAVTDAATRSTTLFEGVGFALVPAPTPPSASVGQQLTFSGTLTSAPPGQVVYLERGYASGSGFHILEVGAVSAASEYTFAHSFDSAGTVVLRIRVPGDAQHQASTSAPFIVTVTP